VCEGCPAGFVSPAGSTSMADCTNEMTCFAGTYLLPGGACMACPNAERCRGDTVCQTGSTGTACAACDLTTDPRYYAFNGGCVECPADAGNLVVVLSVLLIAAFLIVLHHLTAITPQADAGAVKVLGSVVSIAFGHFQISVHLFSLPTVPWPLFVKQIMEFFRNIAFFSFADFSQP
jgi:hypothetical protein